MLNSAIKPESYVWPRYRVVYLGNPKTVSNLLMILKQLGTTIVTNEGHCIAIVNKILARSLAKKTKKSYLAYLNSQIYFLTENAATVKLLTQIDVSLIVLDERQDALYFPGNQDENLENGDQNLREQNTHKKEEIFTKETEVLRRFQQNQQNSQTSGTPTFESFLDCLKRFSPPDFYFPTRRVCVVLAQTESVNQRIFDLGLSNVRGCLINPSDPMELFFDSLNQLVMFQQNQKRSSLCISGGGLDGYVYSMGVLSALDHIFEDKSVNDFDIYTGVSSGALAASSVASGITTSALIDQIEGKKGTLDALTMKEIFDFGVVDKLLPFWNFSKSITQFNVEEMIRRLKMLVPLGFFKGENLRLFFEKQLKKVGQPDSMSALKKELYISVTDQDTGEHVILGQAPWADVKISQAVRASSALPPFYLPEKINGHWFTDGQLKSTSDFNVAIKKGAGLVVFIDPMVAFTTLLPGEVQKQGGYFATIQALKCLVQSRSSSLLRHTMDRNPDVDFIVFRPTDEVMKSMAGNPMHYKIRSDLALQGFKGTIHQVLAMYEPYSQRFRKHGWVMKPKVDIEKLL